MSYSITYRVSRWKNLEDESFHIAAPRLAIGTRPAVQLEPPVRIWHGFDYFEQIIQAGELVQTIPAEQVIMKSRIYFCHD